MKISRRAFGSLIAASALVRARSAEAAEPAAPNAEVEARINWVVTKYGARLDDEQRADVRRIITSGQPAIDAMRAYPLGNDVGPPVPFRVYSGKKRRPPAKLEAK